MAIRAGQILHVGNSFVIDRIQTGGAGNLNIPQEKIYELGNYISVGIVRDVPDLSFSLDCLDVGTEVEGMLCGSADPTADPDHTKYDLAKAVPMDILSPWKSPYSAFTTVKGVAVPQLVLESASYKFGVKDNAGSTFSLKGDSIFYVPGSPTRMTATGDGTTVAFTLTGGPALAYRESGVTQYALNVSVDGVRQTRGVDYTETSTVVTFAAAPIVGAKIAIVYGLAATGTFNAAVHQGLTVKPAAVKGKDINVYFSTAIALGGGITNVELASNVATVTTATAHGLVASDVVTVSGVDAVFNGTYTVVSAPTTTTITYARTNADVTSKAVTGVVTKAIEVRWPDVQSASIDWKITLEDDFEFGSTRAVAREAIDIPTVTGSVEVKPRSLDAFFTRLSQITGTPVTEVIGAMSSTAGALRVELKNPDTGGTTAVPVGTTLKTFYIPATRFTLPGYEGRVNQKLATTINFESDDGVLEIYKGTKA